MNILANDSISPAGLAALEAAGHRVWTDFVPAEELAEFINSEQVDGLLVRSATKVRELLIDACPNLKYSASLSFLPLAISNRISTEASSFTM